MPEIISCPYCGTPYPKRQQDESYKCSNPYCLSQPNTFFVSLTSKAAASDIIVEPIAHSVEVPLNSAPPQISTDSVGLTTHEEDE
jgi:hypothetical protein